MINPLFYWMLAISSPQQNMTNRSNSFYVLFKKTFKRW